MPLYASKRLRYHKKIPQKNTTRKQHKKTPQEDTTKRRVRDRHRRRHRDKDMWEIAAVEEETTEKDAHTREDEFGVQLQ